MIKIGEFHLRRPESKDIEALYISRNDPDIVSSLGEFSKGFARSDLMDWIELYRKSIEDIVWIVADSDDQCIGHCGLYKINSRNGVAVVDVCIGKTDQRGKGIAKSVVDRVVKYGFFEMNLRKIKAEVLATNVTALGMLHKIGFSEEGILREAKYLNSKYVDLHMLGVFRNGWKQGDEQCPQE